MASASRHNATIVRRPLPKEARPIGQNVDTVCTADRGMHWIGDVTIAENPTVRTGGRNARRGEVVT